MPESYAQYRQSWIEKHCDWEFRLWTNDNIKELEAENLAIRNCWCPAVLSDYLRLVCIKQFGGVYVDMDIECLVPIDDIINTEFFITYLPNSSTFTNAFMGGVSGGEFVTVLCKAIVNALQMEEVVHYASGTGFLEQQVWSYGKERITIYPANYAHCEPHLYAKHHYASSWKGEAIRQGGRIFL